MTGEILAPAAGDLTDDECVIKEVDLTVPKTDDPTVPVLTFRMWVLGITTCVLLSFVNQFYWYRTEPLSIGSIAAQVAVVPIGHLMARTITERVFFKGRRFEFTLNPGPFNIKEHVLITIFANSGAGSVYATHILSAVKLFYKKEFAFLPAFIVMLTTQVLGFGWAGIFRRFLVDPGEMWWPSNLVQVSLFRSLHEDEKRPKRGFTRTQFFIIVMICSFAYYIFPGYLFQILTSVSWVCWINRKSVLVNQLGSGQNGLGLGSFGLDWSTIAAYLGSPLVSPWFSTVNVAVGFCLMMFVVSPLTYWLNIYRAKNFPLYSMELFKADGSSYNTTAVINSNFHLDKLAYEKQGHLYMSSFFAMSYGLGFATLSASVVHVLLFNGREMLDKFKDGVWNSKTMKVDVHTRLMRAYKPVPLWWFLVVLISNIALILFACVHYADALQLPWWAALLACVVAWAFTLPIGIISATTNQQPGLNVITEYMMGYLYPGRPVANMCFKVYGYISMVQALTFIQDFKLGHYMKIPPRAMFMAQVIGTVISVIVYQVTAWMLMESIPNLCNTALLPKDSQWKCPMDHVFYDASIIWGLVGPQRIFGNLGVYSAMNYFFLVGAVLPFVVWMAHKLWPTKSWIKKIHFPVLLGATAMMPPASAVNYTSWVLLAFLSGYVVFRFYPEKWKRYNYILSGGLDAGTAFMSVFLFLGLQSSGISVDWWGNSGEGCPLATCPTATGVVVPDCPVLS
ncbi:hypothetical protein SSX86_003562 [Deinandra increscens subsp. villosa]|uniref:Uncharacterized protein n=1 Tax=Deinandra increscens subsp. villosa TaxID=3103831 RepID=A0AAP0H7Z2_9ASTR